MITTINIPNIGFPTEPADTCPLEAILYVPDPALWEPPYHCMVGTRAGGFEDGDLGPLDRPFGGDPGVTGLAERGFLCLAFKVRVLPTGSGGPPGQTSSGLWPQQTNDMKIGIRYMRQGAEIETVHGFSVTGFVGGIGGSGSGHHCLWKCIDGTEGDDLLDAGIPMSPATDYSDRSDGVQDQFQIKTAAYADEDINDLSALLAKSPIALSGLATAKPIWHPNGDDEAMPKTQRSRFAQAMSDAANPDYFTVELTGEAGQRHAFAEWPYIFPEAIPWLEAIAADYGGGGTGPPPPEGVRERVTVNMSGLSPGVTYLFHAAAINTDSGLEGPTSTFEFISDRADTGATGKTAPVGVYALVDAVDGVITGDITTREWLNFNYVDGGILPTTWAALNGAGRTSFDWSQPDAFLDACFANGKQAGISVSMGIKCPAWVFQGQHGVDPFFVNGPNSGNIPIPWDPDYLGVVKRFIIEMGTRYDTNQNLSYITVGGFGQLLDTLLVQQPTDYTNLNALAVAAGYPDLITAWAETTSGVFDMWSKAFRTTKVILAINTPVPTANGGLTGIDEYVRTSIQRYKGRIGFMSLLLNGLTGADGTLSLNSILRDATRNCRGYRFLFPSSDPNCDPSQTGTYVPETGLENAAQAGIDIGAQFEEFYEEDVLTETGQYPTLLGQFQTDLTANDVT